MADVVWNSLDHMESVLVRRATIFLIITFDFSHWQKKKKQECEWEWLLVYLYVVFDCVVISPGCTQESLVSVGMDSSSPATLVRMTDGGI